MLAYLARRHHQREVFTNQMGALIHMAARILIVDDHDVVRQGTRAIIQKARPEWEICGEAATGREAIRAVATHKPDIVILDISMPDMSGIEAVPAIARVAPGCRVLLFTIHESDALVIEAQHVGAQGYVQKSQAGRDLILAVDRLLAGGTFFGPSAKSGSGTAEEKKGDVPKPGLSSFTALVDDGQLFKGCAPRTPTEVLDPSAGQATGNFVESREDLSRRRPGILFLALSVLLKLKYLAPVQLWLPICTVCVGG